ncbi:MAG TPA: PIG-L family deacetylase [Candidatus Dormibacteraeota bacterium]|nr:PIG-L family deacetylase [Candidatus Dormibacteraeota bacterium]
MKPRLLAVLAHPDDESMGIGGLLLRHARAGIDVRLICATRGAKGWMGKPPGAKEEDLAEIRTRELKAAADALGIAGCELWDYPDGGVEESDQAQITRRIREHISRLSPVAVVGMGPDGVYGHPDHIAVGRCADTAVAAIPERIRPALYHIGIDPPMAEFYRAVMELEGEESDALPLVVTDRIDFVLELTPEEVQMKMRAIDCHQSQLQTWRVEIRNHPRLIKQGYGREPYIAISSKSPALTAKGLLGEFA